MAQRFTYDEFQRELTNSGLGSEFSSADLKLAQQNPDAGMSILKYKRDYHNATTPEQRALANLGAEGIRSSYGNYGRRSGFTVLPRPTFPEQLPAGCKADILFEPHRACGRSSEQAAELWQLFL